MKIQRLSRFKLPMGMLAACWLAVGLAGCGADKLREELEIELDYFEVDKTDLYPDEEVHFTWEAESIFDDFEVRFYLSKDTRKTSDDFEFIDEECGYNEDHCEIDKRIIFTCLYLADNSLDCDEDNELISANDITRYLEELPMYGYVIIEVCDEDHCERDARELNLF